MTSETGKDDVTPEGAQEDFRKNVPTGVSFTNPHPDIDDDSLPLDASISFKDNEPEDQRGLHADNTRILTGSEATSVAAGAVDVSVVPPPDQMSDSQTANTLNQ